MARPNPLVYALFLAMSQLFVFSQSAVATLERPKPSAELANVENSSAVTAAKLVAEGMRIEEPATADSRRKAIEKYLQAIPLWQAANDTAREAKTLALIASAYITLGEKQNAFDFANRALPLSEKALKECSEQERPAAVRVKAYVLDTTGRANQEFGDRKKARELYNEAISLSSSINDRAGEAGSLINLAKILQLTGDYPKALEVGERALTMVKELGDRRNQAVTLNNMCMSYQSTGSYQQAFDACNQALSISREIRYRSGEASALHNLGNTYFNVGDYQKALDFYGRGKEINKELGNRRGEAMALNNIGWIYGSLGDPQKSIEPYNQALEIFRAQGDIARQAAVLNNLAVSYSDTGDWRKALEAHLKVLPLRESSHNNDQKATTLENIAESYHQLGEREKAVQYHEQALALLQPGGDPRIISATLKNLAEVLRELGQYPKALQLLNEALQIALRTGDKFNESVALAHMAYVKGDQGNLAEAKPLIEQAIAAFETLRVRVKSPQLRASFMATASKFYEFETDLLMRLHQQRPADGFDAAALASSEKGRARSLLELLAESGTEIREGVDASLLAREQELRDLIAEKAERQIRLRSGQNSEDAADKIAKEINALTTDYEQVLSRIREPARAMPH